MELLEGQELTCYTLDEIGKLPSLVVVLGDRENVDLLGHAVRGSRSSSYVPRIAWEPTTITSRGMVDCMIAAVAWRRGVALLCRDVDLERVAGVIGIELDDASRRD